MRRNYRAILVIDKVNADFIMSIMYADIRDKVCWNKETYSCIILT